MSEAGYTSKDGKKHEVLVKADGAEANDRGNDKRLLDEYRAVRDC